MICKKKPKSLARTKRKKRDSLKEKPFCFPTSAGQIQREALTPKSKAIKELQVENRGLKRSFSKMLSFNEELLDHQDQLEADQSALELEYYVTIEKMHVITNNIAGIAVTRQ